MSDTNGVGEVKKMNDNCGCYNTSSSGRGFLTRTEKIEMLKEYKEQLESETKGVSERIKELQKVGEGA
jgi:hypothetical protein